MSGTVRRPACVVTGSLDSATVTTVGVWDE
jgi:hypothetical protein